MAVNENSNLSKVILRPIEHELLNILKKKGPQTRDQLVEIMGIPRTTIYDGLNTLMKLKEVKSYPLYTKERIRGRPKVVFSLFEE